MPDVKMSAARTALGHELKAVLARIEAENRKATDDESARIERLQESIRRADDDDMRKAVAEFGQAAGGLGGQSGGTSWGAQVVKAASDRTGRFKELAPSGAAPVTVPVDPQPVREGEPLITMRQLIPSVPNTAGQFAYLRQTRRVNNAAAVAPGGLKPTSRYDTERVDDRCRVVAHLSEPIDRSTLADAPLLQQFVNDQLELGLDVALERMILAGTGQGEEFAGLAATSGTQTQPYDAAAGSAGVLNTTRSAITKLERLGLAATGWVFSPDDWEAIELASNQHGYLMTQAGGALPVDRAARRLWSLPVAVSSSQADGAGWLADWNRTELQVREEARVDWSENMWRPDALGAGQGASDFARNMIAFRCEGRFGFAVKRPMGVVKVATHA